MLDLPEIIKLQNYGTKQVSFQPISANLDASEGLQ